MFLSLFLRIIEQVKIAILCNYTFFFVWIQGKTYKTVLKCRSLLVSRKFNYLITVSIVSEFRKEGITSYQMYLELFLKKSAVRSFCHTEGAFYASTFQSYFRVRMSFFYFFWLTELSHRRELIT